MKYFFTFLLVLWGISPLWAQQDTISYKDAGKYIGEQKTVLCEVSQVRYVEKSKLWFINVGKKYPNHSFTLVIFDSRKMLYGMNLQALEGKKVYASGLIERYKGEGTPQIKNPEQVLLVE